MPREKDVEKRTAILLESKRLFAAKGFHAASVSDIAGAVDLPVGSIYTYFKNKDDIIDSIIEEGWEEFRRTLVEAIGGEADPVKRIGIIIDRFLPGLFKDVDFISILLTEAGRIGKLEEKMILLSSIITREIREISALTGRNLDFTDTKAASALMVFLLGSMNAVRLIHQSSLPVKESDILDFIRSTVDNAFGIDTARANRAEGKGA